jgi:hypothetical protein
MSDKEPDNFDLDAAMVWLDRLEEDGAPPDLLEKIRESVRFYHRFVETMNGRGPKLRHEVSNETWNDQAFPLKGFPDLPPGFPVPIPTEIDRNMFALNNDPGSIWPREIERQNAERQIINAASAIPSSKPSQTS